MFLILYMIVLGMVAGWVAELVLGRTRGMRKTNWTEALVVGLIGSVVGGLIISLVSGDGLKFKPSGIIGSILGAIVVLAIWQLIRGRSKSQR